MKVSTDSLLLGSWMSVESSTGAILDVGAGCGILALMAAQRSAATAQIHAIEMDAAAVQQAQENIAASPWPDKIRCYQADFFNWQPAVQLDLIISNPPYFPLQLQSSTEQRRLARQGSLPLTAWLARMTSWLRPHGRIAWVLPVTAETQLQVPARLSLQRRCEVATVVGKPAKLVLLEWTLAGSASVKESLNIRTKGGDYTAEFRQLTRAFYLAGERRN
ncbi:MAG TPA: methyltransferase [Pseudidiomarina sp.]|nr:methyltransferase [Pseudidiomarina sp.]